MSKRWGGTQDTTKLFTTDNEISILSNAGAFTEPGTFLRAVGEFLVVPTGAGTFAALDFATITFGLAIIASDAVEAGSGSMPDPGGEQDYPWLWWYHTALAFEGSADAPGQELGLTSRKSFDIRTMRKFKNRETLVMIGQYQDVSGLPPLTVHCGFRWLSGRH